MAKLSEINLLCGCDGKFSLSFSSSLERSPRRPRAGHAPTANPSGYPDRTSAWSVFEWANVRQNTGLYHPRYGASEYNALDPAVSFLRDSRRLGCGTLRHFTRERAHRSQASSKYKELEITTIKKNSVRFGFIFCAVYTFRPGKSIP